MKKTTMMRIATTLLVAVLVTTCALGATFAKYITTDNGADQATVAKFGVVVNVADDMGVFATEYEEEDTEYTGTLSVQSNASANNNTDNRVAPGTKGQMSFTITGTPEVAVRITVDTTGSQPIHLAAGTYTLPAGEYANEETTVTTTADYEPIKFYFGTDAIDEDTQYTLTLEQLLAQVNALASDKAPNTPLNVTYYIGWEWEFEGAFADGSFAEGTLTPEEKSIVDFLDTYLGNEDALQTEILNIKITVTQIN